jgi:hypothetical protein
MFSSLACPAVQYFSTLSHKLHNFRKKKYWTRMCILICSINFVWNISHSENWARYEQKRILVFMYSTFYSYLFWWNLNFLGRFSKNTHINIYENWSSGSRVFPCGRKDGRTVSEFCETWIFWADFLKILILKFMKIGPVGAESFHAEGRTDAQTDMLDKANNRFSQFCEGA